MQGGGKRQIGDDLTMPLLPRFPEVGHQPKLEPPPPPLPPIPDRHPEPVPPIGSREHFDHFATAFNPNVEMPPPRTIWERYREIFFNWDGDQDMPTPSMKHKRRRESLWWNMFGPRYPLKPDSYVDPYLRPNPCPEEFITMVWRWPHARDINPKIPPPVDGKYNDFYHYFAFKQWLQMERKVYIGHANLVHMTTLRCILKEGPINGAKNCRHFANKFFAMSRAEEFNQNLLYMAITGNRAIRETPYPEDFVEQKRKIWDDWLFRTRQRKPGDPF
jgi:hypothetical protein